MSFEAAKPYSLIGANTANPVVVKASKGVLHGLQCFNKNATTPAYLKIYDKATAPAETDTPKIRIAIPALASSLIGQTSMSWPRGVVFETGIAIRIVTDIADNGTTAIAASEVIVNLQYQ